MSKLKMNRNPRKYPVTVELLTVLSLPVGFQSKEWMR